MAQQVVQVDIDERSDPFARCQLVAWFARSEWGRPEQDNAYDYTGGDPVNRADVTGKYYYSYRYSLGRARGWTARGLRQWVTSHFWVFPIPGCGKRIWTGKKCSLAGGNPIRVIDIGSTYFMFRSLKGHAEGPNKVITFKFVRRRGMMWLKVWAVGA